MDFDNYYLRERPSSGVNRELRQTLTIRLTRDNTDRYVCAALSSINRNFATYLSIRVYRLVQSEVAVEKKQWYVV